MFSLKHPMSIRLQRWMAVVLALGIVTFLPVATENLLPSASANTPRVSAITAADWNASSGQGSFTSSSLNSSQAGWTVSFASNADDSNLSIPLGFNTIFNGLTYSSVFIGSNTYITYGAGSSNYSGLSYSNPNIPGIHLGSADNSYQLVMYRSENSGNTLRIRYEGTQSTGGSLGSPNIVYELIYFKDSSKVLVALGTTRSGGVQGLTNGSTLLASFPDANLGIVAKPAYYMISAGPVLASARSGSIATNIGMTITDTITSTGGTGTTTITMNTANTGVTFNAATGVLTVLRNTAGTVTQTFTATDSNNVTATLTVTIQINDPPSASLSNTSITTSVGRTASETMTVSNGTGTKTFVLTSSVTQTGITLTNPSAGVAVLNIAATNVAAGTYIETITATDAVGAKVVSVINVTINPATTIRGETTTALLVTSGTARLETITASNGTGVKSFVLTSVSPTNAGITLDTSTASSGYARLMVSSAVAAGSYTASITATDTKGSAAVLSKSITVNAALSFALGSTSTFGVPAGTAGYDTLTVTGGTAPRTVTIVGSPTNSGITVSAPTATQVVMNVSSTVPAATYLETITVTDSAGGSASHVVTLTVSGPIRFDSSNPTTLNTSVGRSASARINTLSGNTGKVFTMTPGSTPVSSAITLDTSTASAGYVTLNVSAAATAGSYIESITVVDSSNSTATWLITVNVNPPPVLTYESSTAGSNYSSLSFNGSTQNVTAPANANWQLGSDYTIEWWQYQTGTQSFPRIFSFGNTGLQVSIEGSTFYFWNSGAWAMNSGYTLATKNQWVHYAVVSRNNSVIAYENGKAMGAAQTMGAVGASQIPTTSQLCIATRCGTSDTREMYAGQLTNFTIAKSARYSGTSTTTANFTPSKFVTVDANTLIALTAVNSEAKFTDSSSYLRTLTYNGSPTGSSNHPSTSAVGVSVTTTQGITKRSSAFTASGGTGNKTFTLAPTIDGITLDTSLANNAYIVIADTVTATNSTTARVINETVTVTDSLGAATSFNVAITVNPPIALTATATSFTTTAGLIGYDTITATSGTGTGAITFSLESNPTSSGITLVPGASRNTVLTVARTVPSGTYYETITATDSLGATSRILVTLTVNPGISLAGEGGISTITTSNGAAAQLKVIASNGGSGKTFTMQAASVATNAGITLDTTGAASGFALVKVAASVPANTYLETITVTDSQGGTATLLVTVIVNAAPTLTGPASITMTAGRAASTTAYTAASGTGIKTLTLSGLNSGVTIDTSTTNAGIVNLSSSLTSTNSTTARTFDETVTATDQSGAVARTVLRVTINPSVIETATATSVTTTSGVSRTVTIYATQGTGNKTFTRTSAVASSAITMASSTANQAVLTIGSLTSPGTYYETITATDTLNAATSILITITVNGPPTVSGPTSLITTQGVAFNSPLFQAFGGNGTYTFSLVSNPTAAGITISSPSAGYARISVASTVTSGTYNETLTVTDGLSAAGFVTFTIRVNAPVALSGTQTVTTTYGERYTAGFNSSGGTGPFTFSATNLCAVSRSTYVGDGSNGTINGISYTVDQILGTGTCNWISPVGVDSASVLVVGGGGAGGTRAGGGGGAGGYQYVASQSLTPNTSYAVTVGAGGLGVLLSSANNGEDSRFGSLALVKGGGGGGGAITAGTEARRGKDGGSGGGAAGYLSNQSATNGKGTIGQGSDGGNAMPDNAWPGGGGGGSSGAGTTAISNTSPAGKGGAGTSNGITGSSLCYATGGGAGTLAGYTAGQAGDCGGTASPNGGAGTSGSTTPSNPKPNTGAGGGGSGWSGSADLVGGNGASGVVVLRYVTPAAEADNSKISYLVSSPGTSSSAGLLTLTVPEAVSAGSYSHTVRVTDSAGSVSSPVTINITVNKANPAVTLSLPGAATSTQYGFGVLLSAQASTAGTVQFKDNGTEISGCGSKSTTSFVATCRWVPSVVATRTISAVFTPTDTANYNSGITATMSVVVTKADTLTVTSVSENFTFTNSAAAVTERFTLSGLAEIDSVTVSAASITTTYSGTANDSSSYSSTTAPTKAGSSYAITPSALVFASGSASNYVNIDYVPGVLAIARAVNNGTFNYSSSNQLTYSPAGLDTPTVTAFGEATRTFTGSTPEKCSINSSTGVLSILQAGTCSVTMDVPEGYNYLATTVVRNVLINKASRTIALSTVSPTIKYGDTATVTTTISGGANDGLITYTSSFPSVCQYDEAGGIILATSGSGNCAVVAQIAAGTNYLSATSNTLSVTAILADAPIVTTNRLDPVSYNYGNAISISPTFTVTGLKRSDAASGVTFTYNFSTSPAGTFSYSSATPPTEGGIYNVVPSALTLSTGSLSNYQAPTYASAQIEVEQIDQPELVISNLTGELTFPIKLITTGGAPSITSVVYTVTASTATNCRVVFGPIVAGGPDVWSLQADSAGSCSVRAGKLQTRNYRTVISETATVSVLLFTKSTQPTVSNFVTGVTLSSSVTTNKGSSSCTSNCVPRITSATPDAGYVGDMIVLTGVNFTGATKVTFNTFISATNFNNDPIDPDTKITVQVPVGVAVGEVGVEVITPGGTSFRAIVFELLP